ncbi:MAG: VWA domain-containing protein [Spirochaetes bacterium]|nr:VWA domain-containing protein [Spirochaetota bacterium]
MEFLHENIIYFMLIILAALIFVFSFARKLKMRLLSKFASLALLKKFSPNISFKRYTHKALLLTLSLFFLFMALARPQFGTKLQKMSRKGLNLFVILDVSKSMLANDMVPNRLEKAKHEIEEFIDILKGDKIGIIIFAGTSFLQCPLTIDYAAAKMYMDIVGPDSIPVPGTDIGKAIQLATRSYPEVERKYKVMILLTDGEDHEGEALQAAEEAEKEGVVIFTIGIGTTSGDLIPLKNEGVIMGYKKDKKGNPVLSRLDEMTLEKIAQKTGGKYYRATEGEIELNKIYDDILKMERKKIYGRQFTQKEDRFQYFLLPAVLFLIWEIFLRERKNEG